MVQFHLPYPYHRKLDQKFVVPLSISYQKSKSYKLRLYLVQISCPLQTNQILHDGSALCIISVAVLHLGLFMFLKSKLTDILLIHYGFVTSKNDQIHNSKLKKKTDLLLP